MSNVVTPIRWVSIIAAFGFLCLTSQAQTHDWHVSAAELFVKSSFAHGYMHGYEEGFHSGDLDLQMCRSYRNVNTQKSYKDAVGYRSDFGDKQTFDTGYRKGYMVGYTDAYNGRSFRATLWLQEARKSPLNINAHFDRSFDSAFKEGYETGQKQGLKDGRSAIDRNGATSPCDQNTLQAKGGAAEPQQDYCAAYRSGYELGYSDGFTNQREVVPVFARK